MKQLKTSVAIAIVALFIFGCKKGENDPFLSLKSRKARLCQEWVLESGEAKYQSKATGQISGSNLDLTEIKDGVLTMTVYHNDSLTDVITGKFEQTIVFNKDYTYERHEISHYENGQLQYDEITRGSWAFLGKSKDEDYKNKERITLIENYYTYEYYDEDGNFLSGNTYTGMEIDYAEFMSLDRLSGKELSIESNSQSTFTNDNYTTIMERTQKFNYKRN